MFERSEFGRRALPAEKRRGPARRSRAGSRLAPAVLVTFDKTKVTRASARKPLTLRFRFEPLISVKKGKIQGLTGFAVEKLSRATARELLLSCQK